MQFDGDRVNIPLDLKPDEISQIKEFIVERLDYIEEIGFEDNKTDLPTSSALLAFLISLKRAKPSIKIDLFANRSFDFGKYGKAYWICNE